MTSAPPRFPRKLSQWSFNSIGVGDSAGDSSGALGKQDGLQLSFAKRQSCRILLVLACLLSIVCLGCSVLKPPEQQPLRIWAASSMTVPLNELKQFWDKEGYVPEIELIFGSSQHILLQLMQGAPGDVLITANFLQVERGISVGLMDASQVSMFAGNSLALAVHPIAARKVQDLSDLAQPNLRLAWAQDGVPLAIYSKKLLTNWATKRQDESFIGLVEDNILTFDANAHSVRNRLLQGEVDAAILYKTDAQALPSEMKIIYIDPAENVQASLFMTPLQQTRQPAAVQAFMELLTGPFGQGLLQSHGFETHGN